MMKHLIVAILGSTAFVYALPTPANAAVQQAGDRAATLAELARCRTVPDDSTRLVCFDRAAAALDSAERAGEVVVLDREQVRETNRRLFGFEVANPFAGRAGSEPLMEAIETTLVSARPSGDDKWIFKLADGSEWRQIDSGSVRFSNREGEAVRVRRASLGSYMLTIESSRAVRVRRQ